MKQKLLVDWESFNTAVGQLADRIKLAGIEPKHVMGIPRGGLIPAVMLSHMLGVPMLQWGLSLINEDVLLVDDICDSGATIRAILQPGTVLAYYPLAVATVVCKPYGYQYLAGLTNTPSFFGMAVPTDEWLVFPYENPETEGGRDGTVI